MNVAASTTQATAENGQALADTNGQQLAYLCRSVTPEQAHELETLLTSLPGQSVQLNPTAPITSPLVPPLSIAAPLNQNLEVAPSAPTTQPQANAAAPAPALNQPRRQTLRRRGRTRRWISSNRSPRSRGNRRSCRNGLSSARICGSCCGARRPHPPSRRPAPARASRPSRFRNPPRKPPDFSAYKSRFPPSGHL